LHNKSVASPVPTTIKSRGTEGTLVLALFLLLMVYNTANTTVVEANMVVSKFGFIIFLSWSDRVSSIANPPSQLHTTYHSLPFGSCHRMNVFCLWICLVNLFDHFFAKDGHRKTSFLIKECDRMLQGDAKWPENLFWVISL
jgi:hypothetical protein